MSTITQTTVNADGDLLQWTPIPSGSHYTCLDETTSYNHGQDYSDRITAAVNNLQDRLKLDLADIPENALINRIRFGGFMTVGSPGAFRHAHITFSLIDDSYQQIESLTRTYEPDQVGQWWPPNWADAWIAITPCTKSIFEDGYLLIEISEILYSSYGAVASVVAEFDWSEGRNLSALLSPSRIHHICANDGTDLRNYRRKPGIAMGSVPTYAVLSDSAAYSVGLNRIAGRIYNYLSNGDAITSYIDGTSWEAGDMATISAWADYTPKHVIQSGNTQYAVLYYKSGSNDNLYFSRNAAGDLTSWSAPALIVSALGSEPTAWLVPTNDGRIHCYYQTGSDTPVGLSTSNLRGVGTWA